jgi:hypothetical protein
VELRAGLDTEATGKSLKCIPKCKVEIVVFVFVCLLIALERMYQFILNFICLCFEARKRFQNGQTSEKMSWVQVPMTAVSVILKLSKIEERCQDQSCLFR